MLKFLLVFFLLFVLISPNQIAYAQSSPAELTCNDVTASFPESSFTGEDIKVTVTFKNPSIAPSGTYRVLISTGDAAFAWGGYQDQNLDFSSKQGTFVYTIPGDNFNNAYKYNVYLENPGYIWNSTMCQFPRSINVFNKNFADLGNQCKINMSDNYQIGKGVDGSVFIPNDTVVSFYFEIHKNHIQGTLPKSPLIASTGINSLPVIAIGTPNAASITGANNKTLVPGKDNILQNENIKKLELGKYTAVIRAVTGGGVSSSPAFHFYCASKEFQVSRDETSEVTPGTPRLAPGAKEVEDALAFRENIKSCSPTDPNCTTSIAQACPNGEPGVMTAIGCIPTEPQKLVEGLLRYGTMAAGGVAFLLMLLAAIQMITAEGNPNTIKSSQEKFYSALIGLLLIIFSVLLMQVIGVDLLGLKGFTR